ncbi:MAG: S1 family peptidase [Bifidobacteriaceae bacterium]|jgi:hypothetical protein|nr:S1 family peptidase [Bifidobacteriaceae bacterium]
MPHLKYCSALICGLSAIILTLGTSAVPSLAQSATESAHASGSDALVESTQDAETAPTFGVSIVDATDDFQTAAVDLLGDRFVEFWLTPTQDHFVVGVLDLQASEVAYLESTLSKVATAEVVDREVSRQELDTLAADVLETVEQEAEITSFGVFYDKGIIEVKVKPSDFQAAKASADSLETTANVIVGNAARVATLQLNTTVATEPRVAVVAQTEQPEVQESHYSAPFKGGKRLLKHVSGTNWAENCTAGFLLQGGTDPQNAYGLTAGHCGPNGQQMAIGNNSGTTALILGGW